MANILLINPANH